MILKERAEDLGLAELGMLRGAVATVQKRLVNYLYSEREGPLFLYGPKGSGKTLAVRKAVAEAGKASDDFFPAWFIYRRNERLEMLPPDALIESPALKSRYDNLIGFDSTKATTGHYSESHGKIMSAAGTVIVDDLHYRCEAVLRGDEPVTTLVSDLRSYADAAAAGKRVILVSEQPLNGYGEALRSKEFDEILPTYGQIPYYIRDKTAAARRERMNSIEWVASVEMPIPEFGEWRSIFDTYRVGADEEVERVLFTLSHSPRAFIKFVNLFAGRHTAPARQGEDMLISKDDMNGLALAILGKRKMNRHDESVDFYKYMMRFPVIDTPADLGDVAKVYGMLGSPENADHVHEMESSIREACTSAAANLAKTDVKNASRSYWRRCAYVSNAEQHPYSYLRTRAGTLLDGGIERLLEEAFKKEASGHESSGVKEREGELEEKLRLANLFCAHPYMQRFGKIYDAISPFWKQPGTGDNEADRRMLETLTKTSDKYYVQIDQIGNNPRSKYWILYKPYSDAFFELIS